MLSRLIYRLFGSTKLVLVRKYMMLTGPASEVYQDGWLLTWGLDAFPPDEGSYEIKRSDVEFGVFTEKLAHSVLRLSDARHFLLPRHITVTVLNRFSMVA